MPWADVFCTIMSTLIDWSARARKSRAATPGRSGTPLTVTLASEVSWVTAVTTASSMSASSSTTQVPGSQVKLLRTCSGTLWLRANSTARSISTRPPVAAISSISSKRDPVDPVRLGHDPGVGGEHAGDVGVDLADVGIQDGGQRNGGGVGPAAAERGDLAVGRDPLETRHDGHLPGGQRLAEAVALDLQDLGPGVVVVGDDARPGSR